MNNWGHHHSVKAYLRLNRRLTTKFSPSPSHSPLPTLCFTQTEHTGLKQESEKFFYKEPDSKYLLLVNQIVGCNYSTWSL